MKVLHWPRLVDYRPWGHGAERCGPAVQACSRCGKHPPAKEAGMCQYRGGRIVLCAGCARTMVDRAFHRDLTPDEKRAYDLRTASVISIVPDDLGVLFTKSR